MLPSAVHFHFFLPLMAILCVALAVWGEATHGVSIDFILFYYLYYIIYIRMSRSQLNGTLRKLGAESQLSGVRALVTPAEDCTHTVANSTAVSDSS